MPKRSHFILCKFISRAFASIFLDVDSNNDISLAGIPSLMYINIPPPC